MAEKIKFERKAKSPLKKETRREIRQIAKEEVKCFNYANSFIDLIDACGIYAYNTKMYDRYPNNSYYHYKSESMVDEIDILTARLAKDAKRIGWKIGRREKLANNLIDEKERRKVYKSYLVRKMKKGLSMDLSDLEAKYQYILKNRKN